MKRRNMEDYRIDVIENYASGVRRIFEDYADFNKQPEYYISNNGVIVTLFNRNYDGQSDVQNEAQSDAQSDTQNDTQNDTQKLTATQRYNKIIQLIQNNPQITADEIKDILSLSKSTIRRDIAKLREENKLEYVGSSKSGYWVVKNMNK